jgi:hypothetical protein
VQGAGLLAAMNSGCGVSDQFGTECYSVALNEQCKPASAITAEDLPTGGSMIFKSVESGPVRKKSAPDCCSYDVSETARCGDEVRDGTACPANSTLWSANSCLQVAMDASCPGQTGAIGPLQGQHEDVQLISVDSPPTRKVTGVDSCCYVVRRHWDGG